jgi:hypothetical protein
LARIIELEPLQEEPKVEDEKKIAPENAPALDDQESSRELSKDELDEVAGGSGGSSGGPPTPHH